MQNTFIPLTLLTAEVGWCLLKKSIHVSVDLSSILLEQDVVWGGLVARTTKQKTFQGMSGKEGGGGEKHASWVHVYLVSLSESLRENFLA